MPAIDRQRLKRDIEALVETIDDPPALRWKILNLLDFYADRTKRPGETARLSDSTTAYGVPDPVLHMLIETMKSAFSEDDVQITKELWGAGARETRLIAISLASQHSPEQIRDRFTQWAKESDDPVVLGELVTQGYEHWIALENIAFTKTVDEWLGGKSAKMQRFGLGVLQRAVSDTHYESLPTIFQLIDKLKPHDRAANRKALQSLFESLVERNPNETAGFLLASFRKTPSKTKRLIRDLLPLFPTPERERLKQALST
jgi:hypothetical protein